MGHFVWTRAKKVVLIKKSESAMEGSRRNMARRLQIGTRSFGAARLRINLGMNDATERTPFFVTYLPIYLDYLAVEKGLAKNSLAAYRTDLQRFGTWLADQEIELESVERLHIIRYFQALRGAG